MNETVSEAVALQPARSRRGRPPVDITGQRFHKLTALSPTEKRDRNGTVIWRCRCDCGREAQVSYEDLKFNRVFSCGCWQRENYRQLHTRLTHVAGTTVERLESKKLHRNNKTGVRGVFLAKGRYRAEIRFQGQVYRLGSFDTLEEAAAARANAEGSLYKPFLEFYQRWKDRAQADPAWGAANPVQVQVVSPEQGCYQLMLEPSLDC